LQEDRRQRELGRDTDWHDLEEHRFARRVAAALEQLVRTRNVKALVVAAPPRTLADLRHAFHADVKARIVAEIDKDLTKHPIAEIERHLAS
jgi:protein required for attachment to host cells